VLNLRERFVLSFPEKRHFQQTILLWFRKHKRGFPWREGRGFISQTIRDPYRILVSEVMLQQTQVERVIPYYRRWMRRWPTVRRLARAKLSDLIRAWGGLGYNRRGVYLHKAAKRIVSEFDGEFPRSEEELLRLPGVGRYTARAILAFAYGEDVGVLDINTKRVLLRVFLGVNNIKEANTLLSQKESAHSLRTQRMGEERVPHERSARILPRSSLSSNSFAVKARQTVDDFPEEFARFILASCVQRGKNSTALAPKGNMTDHFSENDLLLFADAVVPRGKGDVWNQAMMDFGAMVCVSRRPKCEACPVRGLCMWYRNQTPNEAQNDNIKVNTLREKRVRFEETDRYFRGRIVDMVRKGSVSEKKLSAVMAKQYQFSDKKRLRKLLFGLVADGLIVVLENRISLP